MEDYLLPLRTPCVYYEQHFLSESEANEAYQDILKNTPWEKTPKITRWVTLMELPKSSNDNDNGGGEDNINRKEGESIENFEERLLRDEVSVQSIYIDGL